MCKQSCDRVGSIRYHALDGMRGIVAIAVMVNHFVQNGDFVHSLKFLSMKLSPFQGVETAVDFFFILSGFVITHSYGVKLQNGLPVREYLWRRVIRLYPMFLVGLLVGTVVLFCLTREGLTTFNNRFIGASLVYNVIFVPFLSFLTVDGMGGGKTIGEIFPANPPAWSLFFEMVASVVFLVLVKLKSLKILKLTVFFYVMLLLNGLVLQCFNYRFALTLEQGWGVTNFMGGFPRVFFGFSAGMLIYQMANTRQSYFIFHGITQKILSSSYVLYLLLILILVFPVYTQGVYQFFVIAVVAPWLVLIGSRVRCSGVIELKVANVLGWLSYPIYCLHYPVGRAVYLLGDALNMKIQYPALISICLTLLFSCVVARFIEEPARLFLSKMILNKHER